MQSTNGPRFRVGIVARVVTATHRVLVKLRKTHSLSGSLENIAHDASIHKRLKYLHGVVNAVVVVNCYLVHPNRLVIGNPLRKKAAVVLRSDTSRDLVVRVGSGRSSTITGFA